MGRHKALAVIVLALLAAAISRAQTPTPHPTAIQTPTPTPALEKVGVFYSLGQPPVALEPVRPTARRVKNRDRMVIPGSHSRVRLRADKLEFWIRLDAQGADPVMLRPDLVVMDSTDEGSRVESFTLRLRVQPYGAASFRVTPTGPVPPGEYVLREGHSPIVYAFGIDRPESQ